MSIFENHIPHVLRPHHNEWCGGTQPPTLVTVNTEQQEARVNIFDDDKYVHQGVLGQPLETVIFLHDPNRTISPDVIGVYACNALASFASSQKKEFPVES